MMVGVQYFTELPISDYATHTGQHNDSRMNIALIMTAVKHGAVVANHVEVTELDKNESGRLQGAVVRDNLTGQTWNVRAKVCEILEKFLLLIKPFCRVSSMRQDHSLILYLLWTTRTTFQLSSLPLVCTSRSRITILHGQWGC